MSLNVYTREGRLKDRGVTHAPGGVVMRAIRTATVAVDNNNVLPFNATTFDPYGWFDTATSRFTPKVAGYYRMTVSAHYSGSTANHIYDVYIRKNGSIVSAGRDWGSTNDSGGVSAQNTGTIYLNGTTDYVDVTVAYTGTGKSIHGSTQGHWTYLEAELVSTSVGVAPEPWRVVGAAGEPAFQNGWSSYDVARTVKFRKDPQGMTHLWGGVKGGTLGTAAFTLPEGYRPPNSTEHPVIGNGPTVMGRCLIYSDGRVDMNGPNNSFLDISSVSFWTG